MSDRSCPLVSEQLIKNDLLTPESVDFTGLSAEKRPYPEGPISRQTTLIDHTSFFMVQTLPEVDCSHYYIDSSIIPKHPSYHRVLESSFILAS